MLLISIACRFKTIVMYPLVCYYHSWLLNPIKGIDVTATSFDYNLIIVIQLQGMVLNIYITTHSSNGIPYVQTTHTLIPLH